MLADGARGRRRAAGNGEGGNKGALVLGLPAVRAGAARDRIEGEDIGDAGEAIVAGRALGLAALADDEGGLGRPGWGWGSARMRASASVDQMKSK